MAQPKKQDLIDALVKQGVTLTGEEKMEDLKKLIAEHAIQLDTPTSVTIKFRDQGHVTERTFSEEVHGENFAELADEFRKKHAARIVA